MDFGKIVLDKVDNYYKAQKGEEPTRVISLENKEHLNGYLKSEPGENKEQTQDIKNIIEEINKSINTIDNVSFSFHEKTNTIIITIKNEDGEITREIPSKDSIKLLEHLQEHMGLLIDESR